MTQMHELNWKEEGKKKPWEKKEVQEGGKMLK